MTQPKRNPKTVQCPDCGAPAQAGWVKDMSPPIQSYQCDCGTLFELQEGEPYAYGAPRFVGYALEQLLWFVLTEEGQEAQTHSADTAAHFKEIKRQARLLLDKNKILLLTPNPNPMGWVRPLWLVTRPKKKNP